MEGLALLGVLFVACYGISWMIGGSDRANGFARWTGRNLWLGARWCLATAIRFCAWVVEQLGASGAGFFRRIARRITPP